MVIKSGFRNYFPNGVRVLVVDDDTTSLISIEEMLRSCDYEVKTAARAMDAFSMLREKKNSFDLVMSEVHMPEIDGFELLEQIGMEMDLPVIMMSEDESADTVMKGITLGACDYLIKPVRKEMVKNLWQHVVRRKKRDKIDVDDSNGNGSQNQNLAADGEYACSMNETSCKSLKKRKEEESEVEGRDQTSTTKKQRVVWCVELHDKFVLAVNQLGVDKAVPKKILELMDVPGITRENVASHLQKYRLYLRRLTGVYQHESKHNIQFAAPLGGHHGEMPSLNGVDLQDLDLSHSDQLKLQSLLPNQVEYKQSTTNNGISIPLVNSRDPMNLFQGVTTTTIDSEKLAYLCQPVHSISATGVQFSLSSNSDSIYGSQPMVESKMDSNDETIVTNSSSTMYNPLLMPSMHEFPTSQFTQFYGHSVPLVDSALVPDFTLTTSVCNDERSLYYDRTRGSNSIHELCQTNIRYEDSLSVKRGTLFNLSSGNKHLGQREHCSFGDDAK